MKSKGYWTIEKIKEDALKYESKMEWKNNSSTSYQKSLKLNIFDDCTNHMKETLKPKGYWTIEKIKEESKKYKTRTEWMNKEKSSYSLACKKGILDECCKHMIASENGNFIIYSYEFQDNSYYVGLTRRKNDRKKEHINDKNSQVFKHIKKTNLIPKYKILWGETVYDYIAKEKEKEWDEYYLNNGWIRLNKTKTGSIGSPKRKKWTINKIKQESLKYKTKKEWYTNDFKSYDAAVRNNILTECTKHMIKTKKPKGYWTTEKIKEEAKKYNSKMEWKTNSSTSYSYACKKSILNVCCKHMKNKVKPKGYWTTETIKEEVNKYKTRKEWKTHSPGSYNAANKFNLKIKFK